MSTEVATGAATRSLKRSQVRLVTVFFMIYILVSGGSFGIEDMVSSSGPGLTILLLILLPIFWSLPMALIASELGSALPGEGGFYVWARRGLGDFWGFQTAWWWSLSIFVDSSVYIVLGVGYLQNWLHLGNLDLGVVSIPWTLIISWALIVAFTVIAVVTKYLGSLWGARSEGRRIAREVGVGMVPRGEVGIVVAGIALAAGAVTEDVYAAVLGMVLATTVISPYLIKAAFGGRRGAGTAPKRPPNGTSNEPSAPVEADA